MPSSFIDSGPDSRGVTDGERTGAAANTAAPLPATAEVGAPEDRDEALASLRQKAAAFEAEVRRRERAEENLEAELAAARLLQSVSTELIPEKDVRTLYERLVDAAVAIMRSEFASMQMFYPEKGAQGALRLLASRGFSLEAQRCWEWVGPETPSSCGEVLRSGKRVVAADVESCEFLVRRAGVSAYLRCGIRSMQSTPLISRAGKLVGMLSTHWRRPHQPSERDLRALDLLVRQAADLLERTLAETQLRQSEERYRDLFDSLDQGFCTIELLFDRTGRAVDYRFLLVNPAFERQTGIRHAAGRTMREIAPQHDEDWFEDYGRVALTGEARRFESAATQWGRHYEIYAWRIGEPEERKVGVLFNDITDRRRAAESEGRLAAIVEHSADAIVSIDLDATIRSWNQGAARLYGYPSTEAVGQSVGMLIPEERRNEERQVLERIGRSETVQHYETVRRRQDGTLVEVSLTVSALKDAAGRVVGAATVARDITERVRAREMLERTVAERTLQLRETVSELEAFSYSIAHDMRAPLRAMNGYARFLEADFGEQLPDSGKNFVRRIAAGATRLDRLITDVLNYTRISRGELPVEKVDIEKLTREIVETYPDLQEAGANVFVESPLPPVLGNPAALTQCVSNLLGNAVKFVAPGRAAHVRIRGARRGGIVRYSVEDNGIGIDAAGRQRIFRMFQRLNLATEFEGSGIGLTIVRKAVERMGGQLGVESTPGVGSVFWIELPAAE